MERFTLNFKNIQLEHLYNRREIPGLCIWVEKMSGTVILISILSIYFIVNSGVTTVKPYAAQLLMLGSALLSIIALRMKRSLLNFVHTLNCTIYMLTIIWTYIDNDFWHDPAGDFLNGYIQGLATYVYICGTNFLAKFFLITLLFVNMSFCNGIDLFVSHFIQITPLYLLFVYKVYADERLKRQFFLSEQQEDVYKYIIQNVLPNGLFLLKYDQKIERVELHSSNQKPRMLSSMRTSDDVKQMMKNTILARDDQTLASLTSPSSVWSWEDTLDGHLRRKIDQTLQWGEKRFIQLKDKNVVRSKQISYSTANQSVVIDSHRGLNIASIATNEVVKHDDFFAKTPTHNLSDLEIQAHAKKSLMPSLTNGGGNTSKGFSNGGHYLKKVPQTTDSKHISFLHVTRIPNSTFARTNTVANSSAIDAESVESSSNNLKQLTSRRRTIGSMVSPSGIAGGGSLESIGGGCGGIHRRFQHRQGSQSSINVQEVAQNIILASSQLDVNSGRWRECVRQQTQFKQDLQRQTTTVREELQQEIQAEGGVGGPPVGKVTDLVEFFSGMYKKPDGAQHKLNLRLSTFYLNEIYGVISIEDESYKDRFNKKARNYERLKKFFAIAIRDSNNSLVQLLQMINISVIATNPGNYGGLLSQRSKELSNAAVSASSPLSRNLLIFELLRIKNKNDLLNFTLGQINGAYPQRLSSDDCKCFSLLADLNPLIEFCKVKANSLGVRMCLDISESLLADDILFQQKQLVLTLFQNVLFNAIEAAPHNGTVAVRVDLSQDTNCIKVRVFNTTSRRVDVSSFKRFADPITLDQVVNDIRLFDRPVLGLRISHWILQRVGPTNKIDTSIDLKYPSYSLTGISDDFDEASHQQQQQQQQPYQQQQQAPQQQWNQHGCTLFQSFQFYKNMQVVLEPVRRDKDDERSLHSQLLNRPRQVTNTPKSRDFNARKHKNPDEYLQKPVELKTEAVAGGEEQEQFFGERQLNEKVCDEIIEEARTIDLNDRYDNNDLNNSVFSSWNINNDPVTYTKNFVPTFQFQSLSNKKMY